MSRDMIRMGMGDKGEALATVGVQPQSSLRQEDAAFDELNRNGGFQRREGVGGGLAPTGLSPYL
jgi:hypothetical protein